MGMPWWHTFTGMGDLVYRSKAELIEGMILLLEHHENWMRNARAENQALKSRIYRRMVDLEYLRQRMCGNVCHGDDLACFYRGGEEFNPCPLAMQKDIETFLATSPEEEEDDDISRV